MHSQNVMRIKGENTNVDKAEEEPESAEKLNATAVGNLVQACKDFRQRR